MLHLTEEEVRLVAHLTDLYTRAEKGEIAVSAYLTPREQAVLAEHFAGRADAYLLDGGYPSAERKRVFFLPEYIRETEGTLREELLADSRSEQLVPVHITGSGFRELAHRDHLGAVLNTGLRREALGDLCVCTPHTAVIFADAVLASFLTENLTRVGSDAVRVSVSALPPDFNGNRQFEPLTDTVPSPRADAVVAALCRLSREKAQALFARGLVEIGFEPVQKPDRTVAEGEVLVVRGFGKFIVRALSDKTKKGRFRLVADKYL